MDEKKSVILGSESSVLDFYTNMQYSNVKKVIITKDVILNSFDNQILSNFILSQKNSSVQDFDSNLQSAKSQGLFEVNFQDQFYKHLQEYLAKISGDLNVELKDYSFMSSISNSKYTVVLRSKSFSVYEYYIEKGALLSSLKSLIQKYLTSPLLKLNLQSIEDFQIEILESEEYHKTLFLKKENTSLILYSTFGFFSDEGANLNLGGELYFSKDEDFNFFENNQEFATLRQNNKIQKKEIIHKNKILNADELKNINQITKNIENATLEIAINSKGAIRILHVSTNEYPLEIGSQKGILYYASSRDFNKIALIKSNEEYSPDAPNPQYLTIKSKQEFDIFLRNLGNIKFDGLIINFNLYHPILEEIGAKYNCDVIFYSEFLQKSLEVNFNKSLVDIEGSVSKSKTQDSPFSSILQKEEKEKDELLEKLKSVDLSTPKQNLNVDEYKSIESLAQSMTSSPQSSSANKSSSLMSFGSSSGGPGEKKSAIELLTQSAFSSQKMMEEQPPVQPQPNNPPQPQSYTPPQPPTQNNYSAPPENLEPQPNNYEIHTHNSVEEIAQEEIVEENNYPTTPETQSNSFDMFSEENMSKYNSNSEEEEIQSPSERESNSFDMGSVFGNQEEEKIEEQAPQEDVMSQDLSRYDNILATRLLTPPSIESQGHLIDKNSLSQVQRECELFIVVSSSDEIQNNSMNYILPISIELHDNAMTLINSANDFFKLNKYDETQGIVLNLSTIEEDIKLEFLKTTYHKFGEFGIICNLNDINYLESVIDKVDFVFVKDLTSDSQYNLVKEKLLTFEKRFLLKNN